MLDITVVAHRAAGRALPVKARDRLPATLGLMRRSWGTAGVVVLMHALRMCQLPEDAHARPRRPRG